MRPLLVALLLIASVAPASAVQMTAGFLEADTLNVLGVHLDMTGPNIELTSLPVINFFTFTDAAVAILLTPLGTVRDFSGTATLLPLPADASASLVLGSLTFAASGVLTFTVPPMPIFDEIVTAPFSMSGTIHGENFADPSNPLTIDVPVTAHGVMTSTFRDLEQGGGPGGPFEFRSIRFDVISEPSQWFGLVVALGLIAWRVRRMARG